MKISIVSAMTKGRVIGCNGNMPWYQPADLSRFKGLTTGYTVIMGRKTFESLDSKPLPNRLNIVISREWKELGKKYPELVFVPSLVEALACEKVLGEDEVFIIGGGELYRSALPIADKMYLTIIDAGEIAGDTFFPEYSDDEWDEDSRVYFTKDERNEFDMRFVTLYRK